MALSTSYKQFLLPFTLLMSLIGNGNVKAQELFKPSSVLEYSILAGSSVIVEGSTNVNEFSCFSNQANGNNELRASSNNGPDVIAFQDAIIKVKSASLNCGNEVMNKNLIETLHADQFENILIELVEVKLAGAKFVASSEGTLVSARVYITLAGRRRLNVISVKCENLGVGKYHFIGRHTLSLREYGIIPPNAFFGLIKVNDNITVQFDLIAEVRKGLIK